MLQNESKLADAGRIFSNLRYFFLGIGLLIISMKGGGLCQEVLVEVSGGALDTLPGDGVVVTHIPSVDGFPGYQDGGGQCPMQAHMQQLFLTI